MASSLTHYSTIVEKHYQGAIPETCDDKDIYSIVQHLQRAILLLTFETFDQSDEETWPDQQQDNDKDKYKDKDNVKDKYI